MATDRSLVTLLRALQSPSSEFDASRLIESATVLLTLLSNPHNVTLLVSQLLTAPAIWQDTDPMRTSSRIFGALNAASLQMMQHETTKARIGTLSARENMNVEEWVKAVVCGADSRSSRWKHMLVLGGLLAGFAAPNRQSLPSPLRRTLETAFVKATNLALEDHEKNVYTAGAGSICIVLGYCFDTLNDIEKSQIHHDILLPVLIEVCFFSKEGLNWGYFLGRMDMDVVQNAESKFEWSPKSSSYISMQRMFSNPIVASLGALSRLASFSVAYTKDVDILLRINQSLTGFTRSISVQWQQNKLSELDATEESHYLSAESTNTSLPLLWQAFKSTLFALIVIQTALLGRVIGDRMMPAIKGPAVAIQCLHSLRNLYFISSRIGHNALSQYTFLYLTSIDLLSKHPALVDVFLRDIRSKTLSGISEHPQERCQDLFFLNTAEQFALVLSSQISSEILVPIALNYLGASDDPRMLEIFEAAHSVMLAVFMCPQNHELTIQCLPAYIETLFSTFPQNLSPRQFRLAIKTIIYVTASPSLVSERQPLLSSTLLELVYSRIESSSDESIPPYKGHGVGVEGPPLSEKATMVLSLIDSLPFLPIVDIENWLPLVANSMNTIKDQLLLRQCRKRFWEILSNGEMDIAHAQVCVEWWNTGRGREMVLLGTSQVSGEPVMSGALGDISKL